MAEQHPGGAARLAAVAYAGRWGWPVAAGTWLVDGRCSCGDAGCPRPGAHLRSLPRQAVPSSDAARVDRWWSRWPHAAIIAPTGRGFDAVALPRPAGQDLLEALESVAVRLPPVLADGENMVLLVRTGQAGQWRQLLDGGPDAESYRGRARHVLLPGGGGDAHWVVPPTPTNFKALPCFEQLALHLGPADRVRP